MEPRGGRACHCVLLEVGRTELPDHQDPLDWIHRPTASELAESAILANRDSLLLALVVRLAMDIKDSTRMLCRSTLASPRRAANSNAALQYQVLLEQVKIKRSWLCQRRGRFWSIEISIALLQESNRFTIRASVRCVGLTATLKRALRNRLASDRPLMILLR